jgi:hypothetical protein
MDAAGKIKMGISLLLEAAPAVPMGSDLHTAILDASKKIGAHLSEFQESQQQKVGNLLQMISSIRAAQPQAALASMGGQQSPTPPNLGGQPPAAAAGANSAPLAA